MGRKQRRLFFLSIGAAFIQQNIILISVSQEVVSMAFKGRKQRRGPKTRTLLNLKRPSQNLLLSQPKLTKSHKKEGTQDAATNHKDGEFSVVLYKKAHPCSAKNYNPKARHRATGWYRSLFKNLQARQFQVIFQYGLAHLISL